MKNTGNYEPTNCKWSDNFAQKNNTSKNRTETINGKTKTVSQWAREYNIAVSSIYNRLRSGWSFEKAVKTPVNKVGVNFSKRKSKPAQKCFNCGIVCANNRSKYCSKKCYFKNRWG